MKKKRREKPEPEGSQTANHEGLKTSRSSSEDLCDIVSLRNERDELLAKLQRVSADYANFQKRVPKQIADTIGYEKERIIRTLLPALDNFEHTLQNAHSAESVDVLVKGIRIIYDQLLDILKSHNVEQIDSLGEQFDPAMHEAMTQRADPDKEQNTILEEFQKGYKLNSRVIRPSKVIVNRLSSTQPVVQQEEDEQNGQENREEPKEQTTEED